MSVDKRKVVVLGLDGLEPKIVDSLLERSELPNFAKLMAGGSYQRLRTTYPAQTPVAWSSFVTGTNPGGHGIFDFITRDPKTYQPDLALSRFERPKNMWTSPKAVSLRKGIPLWKHLTDAGISSTVLRCPCTFPPDSNNGRILAGVGVPDLRGGQGTGTFYTQDTAKAAKEHEQLVYLPPDNRVETYIIGPRSSGGDVKSVIRTEVVDRSLKFELDGSPASFTVREGCWSPLIKLRFKLSMLQSVKGIARFYVKQISPHIEFYISPINFDPTAPFYPISAPDDYANELVEHIGLFSTLGMAEDHNGHNNERFDADAYLAQCYMVFEEREKMMMFELDRSESGFLFMLFDTPDRFQHMFWRFRDPEHPLFDRDLADRFGPKVDELYQYCDKLLGRILEQIDQDTLLIVLSDHGFNSFRRAFDINTWLWQNGLLTLKSGKKAFQAGESQSEAIDWSKTTAYAVGLGGIYLNMQGREDGGVLEEGAQADRIRCAIQTGLTGLIDPRSKTPAIAGVVRREDIYSGAYVADAPDLLVNFKPGFRVSWQSALGRFSDAMFQDNDRFWSGDHIIDPVEVPGILFANQSLTTQACSILDMAPTILKYLGVARGAAMEGKALI